MCTHSSPRRARDQSRTMIGLRVAPAGPLYSCDLFVFGRLASDKNGHQLAKNQLAPAVWAAGLLQLRRAGRQADRRAQKTNDSKWEPS
jgi:hypothetical protein